MSMVAQLFTTIAGIYEQLGFPDIDLATAKADFMQQLAHNKSQLTADARVCITPSMVSQITRKLGVILYFDVKEDEGKGLFILHVTERGYGTQHIDIDTGENGLWINHFFDELLDLLARQFTTYGSTQQALNSRQQRIQSNQRRIHIEGEYLFIIAQFDAPGFTRMVSQIALFRQNMSNSDKFLPVLRGTEPQIKWASCIRRKVLGLCTNAQLWNLIRRGWSNAAISARFWIDHSNIVEEKQIGKSIHMHRKKSIEKEYNLQAIEALIGKAAGPS